MQDSRDLQRRVDHLARAIKSLKLAFVIGQHPCPRCMARPGVACMVWHPDRGMQWADVHAERVELFERSE